MRSDFLLILDFGSQYTQLIARKIREFQVYCEIQRFNIDIKKFLNSKKDYQIKGIILSGGPASVLEKDSPSLSKKNLILIQKLDVPVLGICYGLQLLAKIYRGKVHKSIQREYGNSNITIFHQDGIFTNVKKHLKVWMSHGDSIRILPENFIITSQSKNGTISSFESVSKKIYGVQFHPEVEHTENGKQILKNFVFKICRVSHLFKSSNYIEQKISEIKQKVGNNYAICALSGGVDSSVAAVLTYKAIGKKLICIHIDNGLMRKNESSTVIKLFREKFKLKIIFIDSSELFLSRLKNVINPEEKRKIIGKTFIEVFENEAKKIERRGKKIEYLVQGTLYPDVIESTSFKGPSATIKTHHNVGGLPKKMSLKLIEPLRELFKDEVRKIGKALKIPSDFLYRHPFPGPGLAVRVLGNITKEKLNILRDADEIYINELRKFGLYKKIWQAFSVILPVQTVGVMGDERSYEYLLGLRAVTSTDGMTADFYIFKKDFLISVSNKIVNKVKGINRVVYDITSKPPATIEWE
jgi:GMP synthase (glutamine-hydrolysing)